MATESPKQKLEVKFGNTAEAGLDTVKKAPQETQQQFHSVSSKGDSLKLVGAEVLSCESKDDLKTNENPRDSDISFIVPATS